MRRMLLAVMLIASMLVSQGAGKGVAPIAHADVASSRSPVSVSPLRMPAGSYHFVYQVAQPLQRPQARSNAQSISTQLLVPTSAFLPAVVDADYSGAPISAQTANGLYFKYNHAKRYETFGFQEGGYMQARWTTPSPPIAYFYQASVFATEDGAQEAWLDGATTTVSKSGSQSSDCSASDSMCAVVSYPFTNSDYNKPWVEYYLTYQYSRCTLELAMILDQTLVATYGSQAAQISNNVYQAGTRAIARFCGATPPTVTPSPTPLPPTITPSPTPSLPTDFSVVSVRFEKNGVAADWDLSEPPVQRVKVGTKLNASIYYVVRSLPRDSVATVSWEIRQGTNVVYTKDDTASISAQPNTYRSYLRGVQFNKTGTFTLHGTITLNAVRDGDDAGITIVKQVAKTKTVSFTFTTLTTSTEGGTLTTAFRIHQQIVLRLAWTVRNLTAPTKGTITRSVLASMGGQWKAVNTSNVSVLAVNGKNDATVSLEFSSAGQYRILVRLTIGSSYQEKQIGVTVS